MRLLLGGLCLVNPCRVVVITDFSFMSSQVRPLTMCCTILSVIIMKEHQGYTNDCHAFFSTGGTVSPANVSRERVYFSGRSQTTVRGVNPTKQTYAEVFHRIHLSHLYHIC